MSRFPREAGSDQAISVRLEVDVRERAHGTVTDASGQEHPFWGWNELVEVLQRLAASRAGDQLPSAL